MSRHSAIVEREKAENPTHHGTAAAPFRGLCRTCENALFCTFPRDPARPVVSCDEFLGLVVAPAFRPASPRRAEEVPPALRGLCRTCEERATCTYPKSESGVWHCQEYR